jgi:hypothetical protein
MSKTQKGEKNAMMLSAMLAVVGLSNVLVSL